MLEGLVERFAKEWAVISQAPVSFAVIAALIATLVWFALRWQFGSQLSSRDGIIALKEAEINDYKRKLDGASPDEAAKKIEALERRLAAIEPRMLSDAELAALIDGLLIHRGKVNIAHDGGSPLTKKLHSQIVAGFQRAGWEVSTSMVMGLGNPPPTGVAVIGPPGSQVADTVAKSLQRAGLQYDLQAQPNARGGPLDDWDVRLVVTAPII